MRYTKEDIKKSLIEVGIQKNDTVFFSTSLGMVGLPPLYVKNQNDLNKLFLDVIRDILSEGMILVPTYSYTFGKSLASDLANFTKDTPAEIGSFPNYILSQSDVVRSIDPFMSVGCIGKKCKEFLSNLSNISYGEGSVFEKLLNQENSKCCSIGLGPNWTPFIHYADYLAKVPHRYDKLFWGKIDGKVTPWIYSVRFVGDESYPYAHIAGREAEKAGIWRYSNLGRARVYSASCKEYFDFVMKNLLKNPWYLAKGPAIDVLEKEKRRINYLDIGGDFESGKWINNFLIPERWNYKQAYLLDENNKILSTTPWIHSLSVDKELSFEELQNHISFHNKNMFYNRDFGFVVKEMPKGDKFRVVINSEFGKGIVKIKQDFAFLEEWVDISQYENTKKVFIKGFLDE
jgi:aminoglycoside N3'-acetyltransferase